ncbi:F-box and leucine-rich repeat protein 4 [Apophysomyces ossiformis]|uniref:F-box and leucine-rich repeat protein 4 n=1 Tax=Apophysomyces ossiformis TaxID=679940 RepID=A0A8H7BRX1_9FUNG|nr:F-box and leucine-rich repeat protein 4 [Apophysomyces ossiformis]
MSVRTGRCIRRFSAYARQEVLKSAFETLIENECRSLKTLELIQCDIPQETFLYMIQSIGLHLTHLRLESCKGVPLTFVFQSVLAACPQLSHLSLKGGEDTMTEDIQQKITIPANLILLDLSCLSSGYLSHRTLSTILPRCPELRYIMLYGNKVGGTGSLCRLIQQHCLYMREVFIDPYYLDVESLAWKAYLEEIPNLSATGLTKLILRDANLTDEGIVPLVQDAHLSLEVLDLAMNREITERFALLLASIGAPRLREINLERCPNITEAGLYAVLHACPALELVDLSYNPNVTDNVLKCLVQLQHLVKLNIRGCCNLARPSVQEMLIQTRHRSNFSINFS